MSELFEPIAIVGIAARLPGARDVREYWRLLAEGGEAITPLTDAELLAAGVPRRLIDDPAYVKMAGLIPGADMFDAAFFGMTPREAEVCDPQLRLFLEVTYEAIEDAGYDPTRMGRDVAVYGACGPTRYYDLNVLANPKYGAAPDIGLSFLNSADYLATLVSYKLNLRGPSMAVLTACSSSLAAVHLACRSLQLGECDAAIAGASNVDIPYRVGYRWSPGDVRSADGHCRPFDAAATGTIFTSGAGAVVLKRLRDAVLDADHIWGVICGIGASNDGSDKVSFSAPSVTGQVTAIGYAMALAGFAPADIDCVEMHATGTPLGDPIELAALAEAYRQLADQPLPPGRIPVGSVKSNIGHTVPTSGLAGLLKLVLALEHEQLPPTINVARVNPRLEIQNTPFVVNDRLRPWPRTATRPRRAGLTSLGVGGTNFHLVLEEGPAPVPTPHQHRPRIVVWSGRDEAALDANRAALAGYFATAGEDRFADATATLQRGRTAHPVRGAAVCASAREAAQVLAGAGPLRTGGPVGEDVPGVVFAFPGQGAQHARMAAGLYGTQRVFTETVDVCLDGFLQHGADLYPVWLAANPGAALDQTVNAQPLLFAIEYALARQWIDWGIQPAALLGHSVGELVAATVAGVLDLDDALRLLALRGRVMQRRAPGGMLVVAAAADRMRSLLPDGSPVVVAAVNAADQTVLAGPSADLAAVAQALAAAGIASKRLRTSQAFHSPAMRPAVGEFQAGFAGVRLRPPGIPVYSAATGKLLTDDQATDPAFWARQLVDPVLFADALHAATEDADRRILLEVGPGRALTGLARRHPAVRSGRWRALACLPGADEAAGRGHGAAAQADEAAARGDEAAAQADERSLLGALAELWLSGCPVDWSRVYQDESPQRVSMPGYQFQRSRYWVEPVSDPTAEATTGPVEPPAAGPFTVPGWVEATRPAEGEAGPPTAALALVPADDADAGPIVRALREAGHRVYPLRPGRAYAERDGEFTVRPDHLSADLDQVLTRLAGDPPGVLLHAWAAGAAVAHGDPAEELDQTFFALLDLVQRAGRRPVNGRLPALVVLTSAAVDVSGGEPVNPARAALVAAARTVGLESPGADCRVIDVRGARAWERLGAELRRGAGDRDAPEPVVALRGDRRWLPVERPWAPPSGDRPALRDGGVYVLVGGLGGLGLAVAKGLAATGRRPRLALLARTAREVAADLAEIESMGARVRVVRCDVADRPGLERALDEVAEVFGPINGVLHLAGVAGGGMVQFRARQDAEQVLRPKVRGTLALAGALATRPPVDFVVCFSSRAALTGMVGGVDYAAANAFLDAYAAAQPGWLSINWPVWTTVGMASGGGLDDLAAALRALDAKPRQPGPPQAGLPEQEPPQAGPPKPGPRESGRPRTGLCHETVLSAATHWVLDEHRIGGAAVLPGTALVDLVVRAYLTTVPAAAGPVTLRDLVFLRPLIGDAPRRTRVWFEPAGEGSWRVRVTSTADGADGEQEHVSCLLTAGGPAAGTVRVADLVAQLPQVPPPSLLPAPGRVFTFGPRWQNVERMWQSGGVTVVRLALPTGLAAEARDHALHPALLDTGTAILRHTVDAELLVPFLYRSLTWYAPLPDRVWSRVRVRPGTGLVADVDFVAPDGAVVASIQGFQMRPARLADFGASAGGTGSAGGAGGGRTGSAGSAGAGGGEPAPRDGLSPDEGVRLLLHLLATPTPAQVAVLPYRDGRPAGVPEAPRRRPREDVDTTATGSPTTAGSVQERLADIWRQVLGRTQVEPEDDFFELGGDSLTAVALTGHIRDAFGVTLSIGSLFDYPNLAALAEALVEQGAR